MKHPVNPEVDVRPVPVASALACFDAAANCPKAQKLIYNGPLPPQTAPRCDRSELRPAAFTFCLFFPPENRKYFLGVRG